MDETYAQLIERFAKERAERIKLTTNPCNDSGCEQIDFVEDSIGHAFLRVPAGLDVVGKLRCIDLYLSGIEQGKRDGRFELQGELLDLLGAQRND